MNNTRGYKFEKRGDEYICNDCSRSLGLRNRLERESDNDAKKVSRISKSYASRFCACCRKDITGGRGKQKDYSPEPIATLIDKKFENKGARFGGVNPLIDTEYQREKIGTGASFNRSISTNFDPIIIELYPDEQSIYQQLCEFLDKLIDEAPLGIQYRSKTIEDESGDIARFLVEIFPVS